MVIALAVAGSIPASGINFYWPQMFAVVWVLVLVYCVCFRNPDTKLILVGAVE